MRSSELQNYKRLKLFSDCSELFCESEWIGKADSFHTHAGDSGSLFPGLSVCSKISQGCEGVLAGPE